MAPKKRSRTEAGSSSSTRASRVNLPVVFDRCLDGPGRIDNFNIFRDYSLKKERCVDVDFMNSFKFQFRYYDQLVDWKFLPFLTHSGKFYPTLVLIFYANAKCILSKDKSTVVAIESYLMGRTFRIDVNTFVDVFGLEDVGIDDEDSLGYFTGSVISLDVHDRFLHLIISWWIRPSNGKYSRIRQVDSFWLKCFREARRPNLAKIVFSDIVWHISNRATPLVKSFPYACVLSSIFLHLGIDCSYDKVESVKEPIGETSLNRSHFQYASNGEWVRGAPPPPSPPVVDPEPLQQVAPNAELMAFLTSRFDSMDARLDTLNGRFDSLTNQFNSRFDAMDTRLTSLENQNTSMRISIEALRYMQTSSNKDGDDNEEDDDEDDEDGDDGDDDDDMGDE